MVLLLPLLLSKILYSANSIDYDTSHFYYRRQARTLSKTKATEASWNVDSHDVL